MAPRRPLAPAAGLEGEHELIGPPLIAPSPVAGPTPVTDLNTALVEGDRERACEAFLEVWRGRGYDMSAELVRADPMGRAVRVARAYARTGRFPPEEMLLRAPALTEEEVARLGRSRLAGDQAEQDLWYEQMKQPGAARPAHRAPGNPAGVWALARAIVRTPSRFGDQRAVDAGTRQLNISVSHDLFADFESEARAHPGFRGVALLRGRARGGATAFPLHIGYEIEAIVDGVPTRMVVRTKLGDSKAADSAGRLRSARGMIKRNAPELAGFAETMSDEGREFGPDALSIPKDAIAAAAPILTSEAMLGADSCLHEGATWRLNNIYTTGPEAADALMLSCNECHRERVRVVPTHRVEPTMHLAKRLEEPAIAAAYLARERFHAELAGDERPVVSIEQLRARDGIELREERPSEEPLLAGRTASLGDALAGAR